MANSSMRRIPDPSNANFVNFRTWADGVEIRQSLKFVPSEGWQEITATLGELGADLALIIMTKIRVRIIEMKLAYREGI